MDQDILNISLIQTDLVWEDKSANLEHLSNLLAAELDSQTDLVVLPEMFSTGFSMNPEKLFERDDSGAVDWMKLQAKTYNAAIVGSIIFKEANKYFNRLFFVLPDGSYQTYNKRHLFSFADEEKYYTAGTERIILNFRGWRICPLICYDLRFPEWCRNCSLDGMKAESEYDLLLFVANWPEARRKPWINLLEARAHENQAYVAGVNRIGADGNGIEHSGDSHVFSPKGDSILAFKPSEKGVRSAQLSKKDLNQFRSKFTVWKDKDNYRLV